MPKRDVNREALRQVQEITESDAPTTEELLGSPALRRRYEKSEKRFKAGLSKPPRKEPIKQR
jgi:hypothetical protein